MNNGIQEKTYVSPNFVSKKLSESNRRQILCIKNNLSYTPSFKGTSSNSGKYFWLGLKNLSGQMKEITEVTNALIAAIGTGIIAPAIILCSPGKGDKEDKDKKAFQALRQPLSAGLALGFQVPATYLVNKGINSLAYENDKGIMKKPTINKAVHKFFDDDVMGTLIQDKKYIKRNISKTELDSIQSEFETSGSPLKIKLENKIREHYKEVGIDISDKELSKEIKKEKKKFLLDEIADRKFKQQIDAKCNELKSKILDIQSKDLVTDDLKNLIEHLYKDELKQIEKDTKLPITSRIAKAMGYEIKILKDKQDAFNKEKGAELLQNKDPEIFTNFEKKLRQFVEAHNGKAQKGFSNQKFWLSLCVNLFMVTASCYALNWAHPRMKVLLDKHKKVQQENGEKKVEVNA